MMTKSYADFVNIRLFEISLTSLIKRLFKNLFIKLPKINTKFWTN